MISWTSRWGWRRHRGVDRVVFARRGADKSRSLRLPSLVILFLGSFFQIGLLKVAFFDHYLQNGTIFLVDAPARLTFGDVGEILEGPITRR